MKCSQVKKLVIICAGASIVVSVVNIVRGWHRAQKNLDDAKPSSASKEVIVDYYPSRDDFSSRWLHDSTFWRCEVSWGRRAFLPHIANELAGTLYRTCEEENVWDLAHHFPGRTLTRKQIRTWSTEQLATLQCADLFAVMDLISGEQALSLMQNIDLSPEYRRLNEARGDKLVVGTRLHPACRQSLYYYNKEFVTAHTPLQQSIYHAPVEERVAQLADRVFNTCQKYSPATFTTFLQSNDYENFDNQRLAASYTIRHEGAQQLWRVPEEHRALWLKLNHQLLPDGLTEDLSKDFMISINTKLREPAIQANPKEEFVGLRSGHFTPSRAEQDTYYTPGYGVEKELGELIESTNQEMREGKNPILIAAKVHQAMISIHSFCDGNGRTVRLIADLILRQQGLLPACWSMEDAFKVAVMPFAPTPSTSTKAAICMLKAIAKSYELAGIPLQEAAEIAALI